jgi:hypothetical protein
MQSKLDRGRQNGVRPDQYSGELPEGLSFDVVALWCYLVERAERTFPCDMDGMIDLFEDEFHDIPSTLDESLRTEWNASGISDAPNGDDIKNIAAVSEFVDGYALYYARHDDEPSLDEPDDQRLDLASTLRDYGDRMYRLGVEAGRQMPRL